MYQAIVAEADSVPLSEATVDTTTLRLQDLQMYSFVSFSLSVLRRSVMALHCVVQ